MPIWKVELVPEAQKDFNNETGLVGKPNKAPDPTNPNSAYRELFLILAWRDLSVRT